MSETINDKKELARLRDGMAKARTEMSHDLALQRQDARMSANARRQDLAMQGDLDAMKLSHQLDPEVRDRDFTDLVREESIRLQSLGAELSMKWRYQKAESELEHKQVMESLQGVLLQKALESKFERKRMATAEELEEKLLRFKAELAQEFGELSDEQITRMVEKLVNSGKL